ncbi:MAG: hypothetical protein P9M03_01315 [Candidatus Theseobacter exili]|nr:hypothetical protein [Candidatus Theseobacter exili]
MADIAVFTVDRIKYRGKKSDVREMELLFQVDPLNFILSIKKQKTQEQKHYFRTIPDLLDWLISFYTKKKLSEEKIKTFHEVKQVVMEIVSRVEGIGRDIEHEAMYYGALKRQCKNNFSNNDGVTKTKTPIYISNL